MTVPSVEFEPLAGLVRFAQLFDLIDRSKATGDDVDLDRIRHLKTAILEYQIGDEIIDTTEYRSINTEEGKMLDVILLDDYNFLPPQLFKVLTAMKPSPFPEFLKTKTPFAKFVLPSEELIDTCKQVESMRLRYCIYA